MITAAEFAKGNTQQQAPKKGFISVSEFIKKNPPPPPTVTQKAVGVGKEIVKGFVKPVATMAARPIQLGAELLGASDEQVNEFTKEHFGDWIAPTPQNKQDVYKDAGRAIQTALTGGIGGTAIGAFKGAALAPVIGKLAAEGAGFGLGASMEQGNKLISPETGKSVAIGAGLNIVAPFALKGLGKLAKGESVINKLIPDEALQKAAQERAPYTVPEAGKPTPKLLQAGTNVINLPSEGILSGQAKLRTGIPEVQESIAKTKIPKETQAKVVQETTVKYTPPKQKELIEETAKSLDNDIKISSDIPVEEQIKQREFAHTTNLQQSEAVNSHDLAYQLKVLKQEIVPTDAPPTAYIANLKKIAQKLADEGDESLAIELASNSKFIKDPVSIEAQALQAIQIANKDNLTDTLINIISQREAKIPKEVLKNKEVRIQTIKKSIDDMVKTLKNDKPTRKMVSDLLDSLKCK